MIGRILSRALSAYGQIGLALAGSDSIALEFSDFLQGIVLPLDRLRYATRYDKETDESFVELAEFVEYDGSGGWSRYDCEGGDVKRSLAKAFDKRRRVNVGETFVIRGNHREHKFFGRENSEYVVKRLSRNTVRVRPSFGRDEYLVSTSEYELLKYESFGLVPVIYEGVIF